MGRRHGLVRRPVAPARCRRPGCRPRPRRTLRPLRPRVGLQQRDLPPRELQFQPLVGRLIADRPRRAQRRAWRAHAYLHQRVRGELAAALLAASSPVAALSAAQTRSSDPATPRRRAARRTNARRPSAHHPLSLSLRRDLRSALSAAARRQKSAPSGRASPFASSTSRGDAPLMAAASAASWSPWFDFLEALDRFGGLSGGLRARHEPQRVGRPSRGLRAIVKCRFPGTVPSTQRPIGLLLAHYSS